jgi:TetR/AcrR family transcriptional regulator
MRPATPSRVRRQPEASRAAILKAARTEFASAGVEGARTEEIARAAGVNKALLYYYFRGKEALYGAVLDEAYSGLARSIIAAMDAESDPARRILAYAGAHFDYVARSPFLPKLVSREMMREPEAASGPASDVKAPGTGRRGVLRAEAGEHSNAEPKSKRMVSTAVFSASPHMSRIAEQFLKPLQIRLAQTLAEGIREGAFRPVDPQEFIPTMVGAIVFYFISLPVSSRFTAGDPLSPERLAKRRAAVLDFISAALFRSKASRAQAGRKARKETHL